LLENLAEAIGMLCPSCGWHLLAPANKPKKDQPITWQCPDRKGCQAKLSPMLDGQTYELQGAKAPAGIELAGFRRTLAEWAELRWSLHEQVDLPPVDPAGQEAPLGRARAAEAFALKRDHLCEIFITPRELFFIRLGGTLALWQQGEIAGPVASSGDTIKDLLLLTVGDKGRAELERNLELLATRSLEELLEVHEYNFRLPFEQVDNVKIDSATRSTYMPEVGQLRLDVGKTRRVFRFMFHRDLLTASYLLVEQIEPKVDLRYEYDAESGRLRRRKNRAR
jgi:hypothetical protein